MRIRWSATARTDARTILEFLRENRPTVASRVARDLERAAGSIAEFPLIGIELQGTSYRYLVVGNYRMYYRAEAEAEAEEEEDDVVTVVRIWDGRRGPSDFTLG